MHSVPFVTCAAPYYRIGEYFGQESNVLLSQIAKCTVETTPTGRLVVFLLTCSPDLACDLSVELLYWCCLYPVMVTHGHAEEENHEADGVFSPPCGSDRRGPAADGEAPFAHQFPDCNVQNSVCDLLQRLGSERVCLPSILWCWICGEHKGKHCMSQCDSFARNSQRLACRSREILFP